MNLKVNNPKDKQGVDGNRAPSGQRYNLNYHFWSIKLTTKVLFSSIPPLRATLGEDFSFELSPYFTDPDNDPLRFASSFPPMSGLGLNLQTGTLVGTPNEFDASQSQVSTDQCFWKLHKDLKYFALQPIPIRFVVSDGKPGGRVDAQIFLSVVRPNSDPLSYTMPGAFATTGQVFTADLSIFFSDKDRDELSFSLATPLPGLIMNPTTGILEGVPSSVLLGAFYGRLLTKPL